MIWTYLIIVNIIAAITFILDKVLAKTHTIRVPESILHFLEFIGGVFAIAILIFIIRHKSSTPSYYLQTFAVTLVWIFILWSSGLI